MSTNYHYLPEETQKELKIIAETLLTPGKGILAADESISTIGRRFKDIGLENSEDYRRLYRNLLFSCENLGDTISGVILFHETLYHKSEEEGVLLVDLLRNRKIIPGIKLDKGVVPLYGTEDESTTQGLDDLGPRCEQYKKLGCHFAKWRTVIKIGPQLPSQFAIQENANVLARYASICQAYRIVPIIEPEVLSDGSHNILRCQLATELILAAVMKALNDHKVFLEGLIIKTNMVTPGYSSKTKAIPEEIGEATLVTLRRTVPASVAGILLLSGGQSEDEATINLNAISLAEGLKPWPLTFCFGRALQTTVLRIWKGDPTNVTAAQNELVKRSKLNVDAAMGHYHYNEHNESSYPQDNVTNDEY